MSALQSHNSSITRGLTLPYGTNTSGTPATALTSSSQPNETTLWSQAVDAILSWKTTGSGFTEEDAPNAQILDTAIDYAIDQREQGLAAPSYAVPSGGGNIAFEWHSIRETLIVEFVARGRARFTHFKGDRVVARGHLIRNPLTRQLQQQG